jgi:hypothetical protein
MALPALAVLLFPASVSAGSCDFVLRWDEEMKPLKRAIDDRQRC